MRTLLAVTIASGLLAHANLAEAKCAGTWLTVEPGGEGATIPPNGRLIARGRGHDDTFAAVRDGTLKVALVSGRERVPLAAVALHDEGDQLVLAPTRPLRPGRTYELAGIESGQRYTVAGKADVTAPAWAEAPTVVARHFRPLSCGNVVNVEVSAPVYDDETAEMLRVELARLDEAGAVVERQEAALVPVADGKAFIGHGMCGGEFSFVGGALYQATLTAVDGAGNETPAPATVLFRGPEEMGSAHGPGPIPAFGPPSPPIGIYFDPPPPVPPAPPTPPLVVPVEPKATCGLVDAPAEIAAAPASCARRTSLGWYAIYGASLIALGLGFALGWSRRRG